MSPYVSVIIPAYNVGKWIEECLDSVCGQSLKEIEIVCINDGSTDNTLEIIKEFAARDNRIVIIDKENEGVGAARNDGIRAARGEFVAFMDPDDKYPDQGTLELLYNAAKNNNVLIAGGYLGCMDENSNTIPKDRSYYGVDFSCEGIVEYKDYQCDYQFSAHIFNRRFLIENDLFFPKYARFQDPPFFVNAMTAAEVFYDLNKMTYVYRVGAGKPKITYKKVYDLLLGISDNLEFSKKKGFARLHYISAMRFLTDATILTKSLSDNEAYYDLLWRYIKTAGLIDEDLIAEAGYTLPEPILPELFVELLDESKKYHNIRRYKSIRAFEKLFVRVK